MPPSTEILRAGKDDYAALAEVMFDAVRNGPSKYSDAQRRAWMPERRSGDKWVNRLDGQTILLARQFDRVLGFISVTESGYIDLAFVRPQSQRKGILRSLYEELENITVRSGLVRLSVHASLMAEPAFTRMGFMIVGEETVEVGGQTLSRFEMAKDIV